MSSRWFAGLLLVLLGCITSGCGGGPTTPGGIIVKGRLLNNGKPMELLRPEAGVGMLQVTLIPSDGRLGQEGTLADKDGRFEIRGPGNGVPPGGYKLAVRHWKNGMGTKDELDGRFTEEKTPIVVDVPGALIGKTHDLGDLELSSYGKPGA